MTAESAIALAPDPALPQRDRLLDPDDVAQRLSVHLGRDGPVRIGHCERLRVKYHVGSSLRVLYRVHVLGSPLLVAARSYPPGNSGQNCWGDATPPNSSPYRAMFRDASLNTTFWTFPNDRKIASLGVLAEVPDDLAHLLGSAWTRSRLVAYAPEKCATAKCLSDRMETLAYAKVYAGDDGWRCYRSYNSLHQKLAACPQLRVPRTIAYSHVHRTLFLQAIAGRRVADLPVADLGDGLRSLGAAIGWLHTLQVPGGLEHFTRLSPERLQLAAEVIGRARPDVATRAKELSRQLASRAPSPSDSVCLHGDVHAKNGILSDGVIALIDLDQLGTGPPAADLASLLAALTFDRCVAQLSPAAQSEFAEAFLSGYAQVRELPGTTSLRWHTAAALLAERALRAVNRIRPDGLQYLPDILRSAENLLVGGDRD